MMIEKSEWIKEQEWLQSVLKIIKWHILITEELSRKFKDKVGLTNREMIKDTSVLTGNFSDDIEMLTRINQYLKDRKVQILTKNFFEHALKKLYKIQSNPYFARMDFIEEGKGELEKIYIGLGALFDENDNCVIYDWRAPISSMFYDYQPGWAGYETQRGMVEGEILKKRQYKIKNGEIEYMFDTDIKIDDEILQDILGHSSTGKMKHIVTSIQREQNKIIRDDNHQLLIVQGVAGSGKTSIALHRVAYLLYKYRNTINSDNILVFSPNEIFSDYISNVLPELGEENMLQITFQEFAENNLGGKFLVEDMYSQLEYLYRQTGKDVECGVRIAWTIFKSSEEFLTIIKRYLHWINNELPEFDDLSVREKVIISREELKRIWSNSFYLPFKKRVGKVRRKVLYRLKEYKKKRFKEIYNELKNKKGLTSTQKRHQSVLTLRNELKPLKEKLRQMLAYDIAELYLGIFKDKALLTRLSAGITVPDNFQEISQYTLNAFTNGTVLYEDVTPLLYFKTVLTGKSKLSRGIKYVFVDEAQDYSPFFYEIINLVFPGCKFTILGDMNQSIHSYSGIKNYGQIIDILKTPGVRMVELKNSYRSTYEITSFTKEIISGEINPIKRPGEPPEIVPIRDEKSIFKTLSEAIDKFKEKGASSIALICKTAAKCSELYEILKESSDIRLITKDDTEFKRDKVVIIPSYLSKGLEFDAVLVYTDEESNYLQEEEKKLLYTVCTRALHYLGIYYLGELSPFFKPNSLAR